VLEKKAAKEAAPPDDKAKRTRTYLEPGLCAAANPSRSTLIALGNCEAVFHVLRARQAHAILKQHRFERDRAMAYVVLRISQSDV
jgi:hypothetical protein